MGNETEGGYRRRRQNEDLVAAVGPGLVAKIRAEQARLQAAIDRAVAEDQWGYVWWHHWEPVSKRKKDPPPVRASHRRRV